MPIVVLKDMLFGQPGACVPTKDTYENMVGFVRGTFTKIAMLVPVTLDVEARIIVALIKIDGELRQTTRTFYSLVAQQ